MGIIFGMGIIIGTGFIIRVGDYIGGIIFRRGFIIGRHGYYNDGYKYFRKGFYNWEGWVL